MTLDLTTLEAALKQDVALAAQLKAGYYGFSREGVASALLDRVKDCRTLGEEVRRLSDENERLRVQLAGCAVAALDGSEEQEAASHSYGWSPAYADVLKLRRAHTDAESSLSAKQIALDEAFAVIERQRASLAEAVRALERALADEHDSDCGLHDAPAGAARRCDCSIRAALSSLQPRKDTP